MNASQEEEADFQGHLKIGVLSLSTTNDQAQ